MTEKKLPPTSTIKQPSSNKTMLLRSNSVAAPARNEPVPPRSLIASNRPPNPVGSQTAAAAAAAAAPAAAPGVITTQQYEEMKHRHQLQLALVKQEARELKEEKAFLVAQNLRLERELCLQNQAMAPGGVVDQRRLESKSRPSFHRSRSHPNAELCDPHHSLCLNSPTHSCSSCSSHPWASSGGTNTPSSHSPRSHHSRNPSSASLAVPPTPHAPPSKSRRPSISGGGPPMTSAPDPALLHQRLRLASRQQKLNNVLNPLRPLSVASTACEEARPLSSRSNPASRGVSRRNSLSGNNALDPPLKGILKPSTPIRPLSSCSGTIVGPPTRPSTGMGYYVDEGYDSITHPHGHRTTSSSFNHQLQHSIPTPRTRRGSLDYINGAGERMSLRHGYF